MENEQKRMIRFDEITDQDRDVGGKAFVLGKMIQVGLPVPPGLVLKSEPTDHEFSELMLWWKEHNRPKLAVRSSACGEDSDELSYAGQQQTFLNVASSEEIRDSISKCFASTSRTASKEYRRHFGADNEIAMNVALQVMIQPLYSGVFFSVDPRGGNGFHAEIIEGLGEQLVSGQVNPYRISQLVHDVPHDWRQEWTDNIRLAAGKAENLLKADIDMEWCVDQDGKFWVLQARPVTTRQDEAKTFIAKERERLSEVEQEAVLDGQTFADWTSTLSELTFDIWKTAFSTGGAFARAMKKLGYLAELQEKQGSVLERVFGKAYLNLIKLEPLFFGEIPYRIVSSPRPHLMFDASKLNAKMILNTPKPLWRMLSVGWKLRTHRLDYLKEAGEALDEFRALQPRGRNTAHLKALDKGQLVDLFQHEANRFSQETMVWPFVLTFLIESTLQSLQVMLQKVESTENAKTELQRWMSIGLHTKTKEMSDTLEQVANGKVSMETFLSDFGHRGPGEMDLANERWAEHPPESFGGRGIEKERSQIESVESRIARYGRMRASVISQEWQILRQLLEMREEWKNESLKPYEKLRMIALEIGRKTNFQNNVFWLTKSELERLAEQPDDEELHKVAENRIAATNVLSKVHLPTVFAIKDLEHHLNGESSADNRVMSGESLSIGLAFGTAVAMKSPSDIPMEDLPEDLILIAQSIDPGWTPVFRRAKAVVTENGGVLSHAAIVAREMGIPAVSRMADAMNSIPTGTRIWVDGTHGRITIGEKSGNTGH